MLKQLYENKNDFLEKHHKQVPFIIKRHFAWITTIWNIEFDELVNDGVIVIARFYDDGEEEMFADEDHVASFLWQYLQWQMWDPIRKNYEHIHIPRIFHTILSRYEKNLPLRDFEKKNLKNIGLAVAAYMAKKISRNPRAAVDTLISFDDSNTLEDSTDERFQRIHEILLKNNREWLEKRPMRWDIFYRHDCKGESFASLGRKYKFSVQWIIQIHKEVLSRAGREPEILALLQNAVDDSEAQRCDRIRNVLRQRSGQGMIEYYGDSGINDFIEYLKRNLE